MKLSKIGPNLFLALAVILMAAQAFAASETPALECANEAVKTAAASNFKRYGASTNTCGAKLLSAGDYLETYLVCVSDESDPSEWVVVMQKNVTNKKQEVVGKCGVQFADAQYEASTPNFEQTENGNDPTSFKVWTCEADHGGTAEVVCR